VTTEGQQIAELAGQRSNELVRLLRKAAMRPPIHRAVWIDRGGQIPSRRDEFRTYLMTKWQFSPPGAYAFDEEFRRTMSYALIDGPQHVDQADLAPDGPAEFAPPIAAPPAPELRGDPGAANSRSTPGPHRAHDEVQIVFPLPNGNQLTLALRRRVPATELERLRAILTLAVDGLEAVQEGTPPAQDPGLPGLQQDV
jgi:hypothetical protein